MRHTLRRSVVERDIFADPEIWLTKEALMADVRNEQSNRGYPQCGLGPPIPLRRASAHVRSRTRVPRAAVACAVGTG